MSKERLWSGDGRRARPEPARARHFDERLLSTDDLVFLYQNSESGAQPLAPHTRNQLVETVVYDGGSDDVSDTSDGFGPDDLTDLLLVNDEQLDIFRCGRPDDGRLSHKFGELALRLSNTAVSGADRQYSFKNPQHKKVFESLRSSVGNRESSKAQSRNDRVDDYNLYMKNVIEFVNNAIVQLRRISDGEYLSPKAKAEWCKADGSDAVPKTGGDAGSALSASVSIPGHAGAEPRTPVCLADWEELVHSEIDVRSLTRMFEKKIVSVIPKLVSDTRTFFTDGGKDMTTPEETDESRSASPGKRVRMSSHLDFLIELDGSGSGSVVKKFSSIVTVQKTELSNERINIKKTLPITFEEDTQNDFKIANELIPMAPNSPKVPSISSESPAMIFEENTSNEPFVSTKLPSSESEEELQNESASETRLLPVTSNYENVGNASETIDKLYSVTMEDLNKHEHDKPVLTEEANPQITPSKDTEQTMTHEDGEQFSLRAVMPKSNVEQDEKPMIMEESIMFQVEESYSNSNISDRDVSLLDMLHTLSKCDDDTTTELFNFSAIDTSCTQSDHFKGSLSSIIEDANNTDAIAVRGPANLKNKKSPYESSIFLMEERRKKKLLENRERREQRKIDMREIRKTAKDKREVVNVSKSTHSVTKLSVSNKSFYNSVYGDSNDSFSKTELMEHKETKHNNPRQFLEGALQDEIGDSAFSNCNPKFDLNGTLSQTTYVIMKKENSLDINRKGQFSSSTSLFSENDTGDHLNTLSPLNETPSENGDITNNMVEFRSLLKSIENLDGNNTPSANRPASNIFHFVHEDTPKENDRSEVRCLATKHTLPQACRKSIDKIYDLMNEMTGAGNTDAKAADAETQSPAKHAARKERVERASDTDDSLNKIHETKHNNKNDISVSMVPKVANTKPSSDREQKSNRANKENRDQSLKAVSQLLQEYSDNEPHLKRKRVAPERYTSETKKRDNSDLRNDHTANGSTRRNPRTDRLGRYRERASDRSGPARDSPREKRIRPSPTGTAKVSERNDDFVKKNIADIIDEAKEARGEAVRGPARQSAARLSALAQPRRAYVQAHSEYYQRRHPRTLMADRLQRLAAPAAAARASPPRANTYGLESTVDKYAKPGDGRSRSSSGESKSPRSPAQRGVKAETSYKRQAAAPPDPPPVKPKSSEPSDKTPRPPPRDGPKVTFDTSRREPLRRIPSDDSFECESKCPIEESSAVNTTLKADMYSASNYNLQKTLEDSIDVFYENICNNSDKAKNNKNEENDDKIHCAETNIPSAPSTSITENTSTNVTTDLSDVQKKLEETFYKRLDRVREFSKKGNDLVKESITSRELVTDGNFISRMPPEVFYTNENIFMEPRNPPNSMHRLVIVKSGNNVNRMKSDCETEQISVLEMLPMLFDNRLDLRYSNIPIRIATLGYALSQYNNTHHIVAETRSMKSLNQNDDRIGTSVVSAKSSRSSCSSDRNASAPEGKVKTENITEIGKAPVVFDSYTGQEETAKQSFSNNDSPFICHSTKDSTSTDNENELNSSSSLDILIGLLNEIKKISKCQARMATDCNSDEELMDVSLRDSCLAETTATRSKTVGFSEKCNSPEYVSPTLLHKKKYFDSPVSSRNQAPYYEKLDGSGCNKRHNVTNDVILESKCVSCDIIGEMVKKEKSINVDIDAEQSSRGSIEALSDWWKGAASRESQRGLGVISRPSSDSTFSLQELYRGNIARRKVADSSDDAVVVYKKTKDIEGYSNDEIAKTDNLNPFVYVGRTERVKDTNSIPLIFSDDCDALLKVKKEILVTVYSVLVFMVFAALTFSQILYA